MATLLLAIALASAAGQTLNHDALFGQVHAVVHASTMEMRASFYGAHT